MSISDALVDMLGKPIADSTALCVPTAQWGSPRACRSRCGASSAGVLGVA